MGTQDSSLPCKDHGSCRSHSYNKKWLNKLKVSDFSWTHQRTEVEGQMATSKSREAGVPRKSQSRPAYLEQKLLEP